jgi:tRNA threonylcarbamoyladenosine biosynthesis protein TsaE
MNHNETENLGFKFSKLISKGDIITLNGDLGSGKTTFVKGVLKGLSYTQEVTSPTYTLINEYNALYNIIHIDCYREKKIDRWLNIGLMDYFETDSIFFIEWAENIKDLLPNKTIDLFFHIIDSNQRLIKYNE